MPPATFFMLRVPFSMYGLLCSYTNFKVVFQFVKNVRGILMGVALNL